MGLALGVAAMFIGVVFVISGWKGGGPPAMEQNLIGMLKGEYLPAQNPGQKSAFDTGNAPATSTTGGANSSGNK